MTNCIHESELPPFSKACICVSCCTAALQSICDPLLLQKWLIFPHLNQYELERTQKSLEKSEWGCGQSLPVVLGCSSLRAFLWAAVLQGEHAPVGTRLCPAFGMGWILLQWWKTVVSSCPCKRYFEGLAWFFLSLSKIWWLGLEIFWFVGVFLFCFSSYFVLFCF